MSTIKIPCLDGHQHDVEAVAFGKWAAHRILVIGCDLIDEWWTVTFVPSGMCMGAVKEWPEVAIAIARRLNERTPDPVDDPKTWTPEIKERMIGVRRAVTSAFRVLEVAK